MGKEFNSSPIGYFIFSMDTELSIGAFDKDEKRKALFAKGAGEERRKMERLLDIFNEYQVIGTWAIVGHMFFQRCEYCPICPVMDWKGKYRSFDEAYGTDNPLWYGADVIEMIEKRAPNHEIAYHGYIHEIYNESSMPVQRALVEIQEWLRVSKRFNIKPTAIVFPRNKVGYLKLFEQNGFTCYRSEEHIPRLLEISPFGPLLKTLVHLLPWTCPPIYALTDFKRNGMVNLFASQHLFGYDRRVELFLDSKNLPYLRIQRILRSIRKAAEEKKVVHIWAHPWEFRTDKDFDKLRLIFECVAEEVEKGKMACIGMSELAEQVI